MHDVACETITEELGCKFVNGSVRHRLLRVFKLKYILLRVARFADMPLV